MKRAWIAVGLIVASLTAGITEYLYTAAAAAKYSAMLDEADTHMERSEMDQAQSVAERLDHRFGEDSRLLHIFSFHSDVNAISYDLAAMRRYAQTGSTADFLAQSAQARRKILALSQLRAPRLGNLL